MDLYCAAAARAPETRPLTREEAVARLAAIPEARDGPELNFRFTDGYNLTRRYLLTDSFGMIQEQFQVCLSLCKLVKLFAVNAMMH